MESENTQEMIKDRGGRYKNISGIKKKPDLEVG